jgi:hypothetical protein
MHVCVCVCLCMCLLVFVLASLVVDGLAVGQGRNGWVGGLKRWRLGGAASSYLPLGQPPRLRAHLPACGASSAWLLCIYLSVYLGEHKQGWSS